MSDSTLCPVCRPDLYMHQPLNGWVVLSQDRPVAGSIFHALLLEAQYRLLLLRQGVVALCTAPETTL